MGKKRLAMCYGAECLFGISASQIFFSKTESMLGEKCAVGLIKM